MKILFILAFLSLIVSCSAFRGKCLSSKLIKGLRTKMMPPGEYFNPAPVPSPPPVRSPSIYIGNLPFSVTEDGIKGVLLEHLRLRPTRVSIIKDKYTGQPKGYAFVDFATLEECQAAVMKLDKAHLDGRMVKCNIRIDRPETDSHPPRFVTGQPGHLDQAGQAGHLDQAGQADPAGNMERRQHFDEKRTVFVNNIPPNVALFEIENLVRDLLGPNLVSNIHHPMSRKFRGQKRPYCYIELKDGMMIDSLIQALHGVQFRQRSLFVERFVKRTFPSNEDGHGDDSIFDNSDSNRNPNNNGNQLVEGNSNLPADNTVSADHPAASISTPLTEVPVNALSSGADSSSSVTTSVTTTSTPSTSSVVTIDATNSTAEVSSTSDTSIDNKSKAQNETSTAVSENVATVTADAGSNSTSTTSTTNVTAATTTTSTITTTDSVVAPANATAVAPANATAVAPANATAVAPETTKTADEDVSTSTPALVASSETKTTKSKKSG